MKKILTNLAVVILVLIFSSHISASGYVEKTEFEEEVGSIEEAIKYTKMARIHGDDTQKILEYAQMSLKYAEKAEKDAIEEVNVPKLERIATSISHLEEAIRYADMGHVDFASKHIQEALNEMHRSTAK